MNKKYTTFVCIMLLITYAVPMTMISPLLSEISRTFDLNLIESGTIFTANFLGFIVFVLLGGVLCDLYGTKKIVLISLLGFAVMLALFPITGSFFVALAVAFLMFGFGGVVETMASAVISDLNPERSSFYLNLAHAIFGIGALAGPIFASTVISNNLSWKLCYYICAIYTLLVFFLFLPAKLPEKKKDSKINKKILRNLVTNKKLVLLCLCMFLYTGSEVGSWGWMSTFLKESLNFSLRDSAFAVSAFWLSMTIGRLICGPLSNRFNLKNIVLFLAFTSSLITLASGLTTSPIAVWTLICLMGLTYSGQWPLIVAFGGRCSDKNLSGTVFSMLTSSGGLGTAVIPFLMGMLGQFYGMKASMLLPSVFLMGIFIIFLKLRQNDHGNL